MNTPVPKVPAHDAGVTLRDYFAAAALQGLITADGPCPSISAPAYYGGWAYEAADAMLKARDRGQTPEPVPELIPEPVPEPDWHNPYGMVDAGEGYRFCLKTETRQDATHYWFEGGWHSVAKSARPDFLSTITYRTDKPLPVKHTTDNLMKTPEQTHDESLRAFGEEMWKIISGNLLTALCTTEGTNLVKKAHAAGLLDQAPYDPEKHGHVDDAEPGMPIWVLGDQKYLV